MLDINFIKENQEIVKDGLKKKGWDFDAKPLLEKVEQKRELVNQADNQKAERNKLSASVVTAKKAGDDVQGIFDKVKQINASISNLDKQIEQLDNQINKILFELPNLPDKDLLPGGKENNVVVKTFKQKPEFDFKTKDHVELAESLGLIDYQAAAKMSGRGTWVYTGDGARLEWALLNFFISEHMASGYKFLLPPHIMNYESGFTAGQFPKFGEDVFWLEATSPKKYLLPTSETPIVNYHRNEILKEEDLPKKYFSYTPCYRLEAGSYRNEERGTVRGFQFNKVEMFQFTTQQNSVSAFDELVLKAEDLVEKLGLHYQTSKLAAGDCSHSMARTYEVEVWIPSMQTYKEVSSVSNARDYQARRGKIRYRDKDGKTHFAHTLNGSGLATSRLFPAILEQNQNPDGTVTIPEVLVPFMGGQTLLTPKK